MLETLTDPFAQAINQRAVAELVILGLVCGPFGVWVVLFRQSYAAESIAHSMLPGLVLASLVGVPLGLGAAAGLALAGACIAICSLQRRVSTDVAVAVVVTTLFGAGSLLALAPDAPLRIGELLFGDPLSVSEGDLLASGALALALLAALAAGHRPLTLVGFDAPGASSLGTSPRLVAAGLLIVLAMTTLIAVQALGNLLVVAIVVAPAAAALRTTSRLPAALAAAAGIGAAAGVAGMYLSFYANVAAGAAVALCAVGAFALTLPFGAPAQRAAANSSSPVDAIGGSAG